MAKQLYEIFCCFGHPKILQSDNGLEFVNSIINEVTKLYGIDKRTISSYHPQANGLVERSNHSIIDLIRHVTSKKTQNWSNILPSVQLMMNNRVTDIHSSTPFSILFARKLNHFKSYDDCESLMPTNEMIQERLKFIENVLFPSVDKKMQTKIEKRNKYWNKKHQLVDYSIGSTVMAKNLLSVNKLDSPYLGPYKIIRKTRGNAYILMDSAGTVLERRFPPDQLKKVNCNAFLC